MARNYGTIEVTWWDDPHTRRLSYDAVVLYIYLRTTRHCSGSMAFNMPMSYIVEDTRLPHDRAVKAMHELALKPFALWDSSTKVVFLPGVIGTLGNKLPNQNVAAYMSKQLLALPDCELKARAIAEIISSGQFTKTVQGILGSWKFDASQQSLVLSIGDQGSLLPAEAPPSSVPKRPKAEATRLPSDWRAPAEYRDYADKIGISNERIDAMEIKFVRYWTGPDAKVPAKKDWFRTWCNWVDNEAERAGSNGGARAVSPQGHVVQSGPDWASREKMFYEKGIWLGSWDEQPDHPDYKHGKPKVPPPVP